MSLVQQYQKWVIDPAGQFKQLQPWQIAETLGLIPEILSTWVPGKDMEELINENYAHGGGWCGIDGGSLDAKGNLLYPEDPPYRVLAQCQFGDDTVRIHTHAMVTIQGKDGKIRTTRMD